MQLTGHEQDVLNTIIEAGGSVAGFSFAEQSSVDVLQSLVSKGAVYLQGGRVHAAKPTLDLTAELDALRAENARLNRVITSMLNQLAKLGETVEESEEVG